MPSVSMALTGGLSSVSINGGGTLTMTTFDRRRRRVSRVELLSYIPIAPTRTDVCIP